MATDANYYGIFGKHVHGTPIKAYRVAFREWKVSEPGAFRRFRWSGFRTEAEAKAVWATLPESIQQVTEIGEHGYL